MTTKNHTQNQTHTETEQRVAVFVTTKHAIAETGGNTGKWFVLGDYANKTAFLAAATEFANVMLDDPNPEFVYTNHYAVVSLERYITETELDEKLWDIVNMETDSIIITNFWQDRYGMVDDSISRTYHAGCKHFQGCFDTALDYTTTALSRAGANGYLKDALAKHSALNDGTPLKEVAETAWANDKVLAMLGDHTTLDEVATALTADTWVRDRYWFKTPATTSA